MQKKIKTCLNVQKGARKTGLTYILFLLLISVFCNSGQLYAQSNNLTLDFANAQITDVFKAIETKTLYRHFYQRV